MADYPNSLPKIKKTVGKNSGSMKVIDNGVEGRVPEASTVRKNSVSKNKKSAGHVGDTNMSHV